MIVDFPEAKSIIKKALDSHVRNEIHRKAPMLQFASFRPFHEGDKLSVKRTDGTLDVSQVKTVHSGFSVLVDEIPQISTDDFLNKVSSVADDIANQIEKHMLQRIDEAVNATGNIIESKSINIYIILEMLENMPMSFEFDDINRPVKPGIMAAPQTIAKLQELFKKATDQEIEEFRLREKEIIETKYKEYLKDLESRKIID